MLFCYKNESLQGFLRPRFILRTTLFQRKKYRLHLIPFAPLPVLRLIDLTVAYEQSMFWTGMIIGVMDLMSGGNPAHCVEHSAFRKRLRRRFWSRLHGGDFNFLQMKR